MSRPSDDGPSQSASPREKRPTQPDAAAAGGSTSGTPEPDASKPVDSEDEEAAAGAASADETDGESEAGRCLDCGARRPLEISYTIEDLDTLDQAARQQRQLEQSRRPEVRRYRSFLSPDDALRDLRKHASQGAEIRWELHTSRTDVDLASRAKCSCHSLTPREEKRHPERGDLRKHHSAEGDKWSLKPDTEHDLRKHLSDDSRMAREPKWSLQVPELHANPKQRCTCPKQPPAALSPSPSPSLVGSRRHSLRLSDEEARTSRRTSRSLTPEDPQQQQQHSRRVSPDSRSSRERSSVSPAPAKQEAAPPQQPQAQVTVQQQQQQQQQQSRQAAKVSRKERAQLTESRRAMRSKWAVKPHFSLPAERKESKWFKGHEDGKSKSLKERPKYSVRRSMSPDPDRDVRQVLKLDNRVVRRLISPEISIMDAKWAPYEGHSPLPNVGIKKRETKKISDIKWVPYDESPLQPKPPPEPEIYGLEEPPEEAKGWGDFGNVTPTHLPPPEATPMRSDDEEFRMRMLNQVSAFPIYQGAWREESPPPTPPPPDLSTPVWSPQTPGASRLRKQSSQMPRPTPTPSPSPPPQKRSTLKVRTSRKKSAARAKSQDSTRRPEERHQSTRQQQPPPPVQQQQQQQSSRASTRAPLVARASSEEARRRRPQLMRSKALLLEVPHIDASKRSLSEEVRGNARTESTKRGLIFRAKSEDAARHGVAWYDDEDRQELREYVTTV